VLYLSIMTRAEVGTQMETAVRGWAQVRAELKMKDGAISLRCLRCRRRRSWFQFRPVDTTCDECLSEPLRKSIVNRHRLEHAKRVCIRCEELSA
jgi:hypothetical protein